MSCPNVIVSRCQYYFTWDPGSVTAEVEPEGPKLGDRRPTSLDAEIQVRTFLLKPICNFSTNILSILR